MRSSTSEESVSERDIPDCSHFTDLSFTLLFTPARRRANNALILPNEPPFYNVSMFSSFLRPLLVEDQPGKTVLGWITFPHANRLARPFIRMSFPILCIGQNLGKKNS